MYSFSETKRRKQKKPRGVEFHLRKPFANSTFPSPSETPMTKVMTNFWNMKKIKFLKKISEKVLMQKGFLTNRLKKLSSTILKVSEVEITS